MGAAGNECFSMEVGDKRKGGDKNHWWTSFRALCVFQKNALIRSTCPLCCSWECFLSRCKKKVTIRKMGRMCCDPACDKMVLLRCLAPVFVVTQLMVVKMGNAEHGSWTIFMTSAGVSTHVHRRLILQDGTSDAQEPNRCGRFGHVILLPHTLQRPAHVFVTECDVWSTCKDGIHPVRILHMMACTTQARMITTLCMATVTHNKVCTVH